ncbi:hypothetical protein J6590_087138 [Homalodisca vitripennis]|nr:hypothetical protein J6590_087138 [Homalodisca vitripennis]
MKPTGARPTLTGNHTNPQTQRFRDVLTSFDLVWSVNTPTRVTARSSTAIDNVITNFPGVSVTVLDAAISDHFAQKTVIKQFNPKYEPSSAKFKRDLKNENIKISTDSSKENLGYLWMLLNT